MIIVPICSRPANIPANLPFLPSTPAPPSEPPSKLIARLYEEERSFVRRIVVRRGVPTRDAEDVVQDVFVVVCRRIADLDPTNPARPWLYVIAFQTASNYRKLARHRREDLSGVVPEAPAMHVNLDELLAFYEERSQLRARLQRLGLKLRAVVVPHIIEERSIPEIAASLGIPEKTAYSRMSLARTALSRHTCSPRAQTARRHQHGHTSKR